MANVTSPNQTPEQMKALLDKLDKDIVQIESEVSTRRAYNKMLEERIAVLEEELKKNGVDVSNLEVWIQEELGKLVDEVGKAKEALGRAERGTSGGPAST